MKLNVIIDSSIRFNPTGLSKSVIDEILSPLKVPNPARKAAEREMLWGAKQIPEFLELWKYKSHNELVLPRGNIYRLEHTLYNNNIEFQIESNVEDDDNYLYEADEISLRFYQVKALNELVIKDCGIYKSLTGSGKTRVMLELVRQLHQKTIIFVEKKDIAQQWIDMAFEFGFDVGWAREGNFDVDKDLVIAMRQTVWSKKDELDQEWFHQWGAVIWDEVHHIQSNTAFDLIQRFPARYRFGCSATPDSDEDLFPIVSAVIGPVVSESTPEEIGDHLVIPSVRVIKTEFEFPYRPTVRAEKSGIVVRNNYAEMMGALESDWERNHLIGKLAAESAMTGHSVIVVSKRKNHLIFLKVATDAYVKYFHGKAPWINTYLLTGDNSNEYNSLRNELEKDNNGFVLFSTLASEGTDIPCLDRIFLAYPGRKLRGFEQAIGRVMRTHPKKKDAIIYDFRDANVPLLNSQYRFRAQGIYNKRGYKVEQI